MAGEKTKEQAQIDALNAVAAQGETPSPEALVRARGNYQDSGAPPGDVYGLKRVEQEQR